METSLLQSPGIKTLVLLQEARNQADAAGDTATFWAIMAAIDVCIGSNPKHDAKKAIKHLKLRGY